jgi:hypothetical protein
MALSHGKLSSAQREAALHDLKRAETEPLPVIDKSRVGIAGLRPRMVSGIGTMLAYITRVTRHYSGTEAASGILEAKQEEEKLLQQMWNGLDIGDDESELAMENRKRIQADLPPMGSGMDYTPSHAAAMLALMLRSRAVNPAARFLQAELSMTAQDAVSKGLLLIWTLLTPG